MPKSESIGHSWRPLARALTSGIALLLLVTGCSTDAPQQVETPSLTPTTRTTEATTAPEETPEPQAITTDPELPAIPEPPVLPDAAKENTEEGASAFIDHFLDAFNYSAATGQTETFSSLYGKDCSFCDSLTQAITDAYTNNQRIQGLQLTLVAPTRLVISNDQVRAYEVDYRLSEYKLVTPNGTTTFDLSDTKGALILGFAEKSWTVEKFGAREK